MSDAIWRIDMDLTDLGRVAMEQMEAIEGVVPEDAKLVGVLTGVVVQRGEGSGEVRCRVSLPLDPEERKAVSSLLVKGVMQYAITEDWI